MGTITHAYYGKAETLCIVLKTKMDIDQELSIVMRNGGVVSIWSCSDGQVFSDTNDVTFAFTDDSEKTIKIYADRHNVKSLLWALGWKATFIDLSKSIYMETVELNEVGNPDFTNLIMPSNMNTITSFSIDGVTIV